MGNFWSEVTEEAADGDEPSAESILVDPHDDPEKLKFELTADDLSLLEQLVDIPHELVLFILGHLFVKLHIPKLFFQKNINENPRAIMSFVARFLYGRFLLPDLPEDNLYLVFSSLEILEFKYIPFVPWSRVENLKFNYVTVPSLSDVQIQRCRMLGSIENFEVDRAGLRALARLPYLFSVNKLWFRGDFSDEVIQALNRMRKLQTLGCECIRAVFSDTTLNIELPVVTRLSFSNRAIVNRRFHDCFPILTNLFLECGTLSSEQVESISLCQQLRVLRFVRITFEASIECFLVGQMRSLRRLSLSWGCGSWDGPLDEFPFYLANEEIPDHPLSSLEFDGNVSNSRTKDYLNAIATRLFRVLPGLSRVTLSRVKFERPEPEPVHGEFGDESDTNSGSSSNESDQENPPVDSD